MYWPLTYLSRVNGPDPTPSWAGYFVRFFAEIFSQRCFGTMYVSPRPGSLGSGTEDVTTIVRGFGAFAVRLPTNAV